MLRILAIAGLISLSSPPLGAKEVADGASRPHERSEANLGLNVFGLSFHTDRDKGYNEFNPGIGLRYTLWRPAPGWSVLGDSSIYYDSSRAWAKYLGVGAYYSLTSSWKVGVTIVYAQSESYNRGKPFFAAVPGLTFDYRPVVLNVVLLPSEDAASKVTGLAVFLTIPIK